MAQQFQCLDVSAPAQIDAILLLLYRSGENGFFLQARSTLGCGVEHAGRYPASILHRGLSLCAFFGSCFRLCKEEGRCSNSAIPLFTPWTVKQMSLVGLRREQDCYHWTGQQTMPKAQGAERAWPFCLMRSLTTHRSNLNNFVQLISGAVWSEEIVAAAVCHHRASRDTIADELAQPAACRTVGRARVVKRGPFGSTRSGVAREGWTSPHCRSSTSNEAFVVRKALERFTGSSAAMCGGGEHSGRRRNPRKSDSHGRSRSMQSTEALLSVAGGLWDGRQAEGTHSAQS